MFFDLKRIPNPPINEAAGERLIGISIDWLSVPNGARGKTFKEVEKDFDKNIIERIVVVAEVKLADGENYEWKFDFYMNEWMMKN